MGIKKQIGIYKKGAKNSITDVEGVKVGQVTINKGGIQTGVTSISKPCCKWFFKTTGPNPN